MRIKFGAHRSIICSQHWHAKFLTKIHQVSSLRVRWPTAARSGTGPSASSFSCDLYLLAAGCLPLLLREGRPQSEGAESILSLQAASPTLRVELFSIYAAEILGPTYNELFSIYAIAIWKYLGLRTQAENESFRRATERAREDSRDICMRAAYANPSLPLPSPSLLLSLAPSRFLSLAPSSPPPPPLSLDISINLVK